MQPGERTLPWIAVAVGGFLGTGARAAIDLLLPHATGEVPWSTLLINALGCFALGILVPLVYPRVPGWVASGLGVGVLGGFTTYSAYAVAIVAIARGGIVTGDPLAPGDLWESVLVLAGGFLSALFFAWLGLASGRTATRYKARTADEVVRELDAEDERDEE